MAIVELGVWDECPKCRRKSLRIIEWSEGTEAYCENVACGYVPRWQIPFRRDGRAVPPELAAIHVWSAEGDLPLANSEDDGDEEKR